MLKFQRVLADRQPPGSALSQADIAAAVGLLGADDVAAIVRWMDRLAGERDELPDWDGDAADDIWRAQRDLAMLLTGLGKRFAGEVEAALAGASPETLAMVEAVTRAGK
ncbi:hypothetical protein [Devosia sediminis]|uniref:Uncharacterized protein n=1 Tax=Devosia sediminis TaxID=2798801 RepID=A0A934MKE3_9HYPH|nr:hypothetical protein [Devosia sediminis]MBJ3783466.1 hypothetical protein [Devosia sediminis]